MARLVGVLSLITFAHATINITAPTYIIDTSKPANEYLKEICTDFGPHANDAFSTMMDMIPPALMPEFRTMAYRYWLDIRNQPSMQIYTDEITYLSQCLGRSIDDLITVNLVYEFTAFCTSIVAMDKNGRILHGRNQDFPTILRNDTVNMKYVDAAGNELYEATTFFGYVGIPTGRKLNAFSITIDARFGIDYWNNLESIHSHNFPSGWLVRECFIKDTTFDECVKRLEDTTIMAPIYYIVAGDDKSANGAVITRNVTDAIDTWYLKDSIHQWYIIETNYDHWTNASQHFDARRSEAIKMLDNIGQENITYDTLFEVLSTPPVLASNTVYTSLLSPSNTDPSAYNVTVRFDTAAYPEVKFRPNLPAKITKRGDE